MPKEQDSEEVHKMRDEARNCYKWAKLLGVGEEEYAIIKGISSFPEIEARKAKSRQIFGEHNSFLEARLQEYLIESARGPRAIPKEHEECFICRGKYVGAYSVCAVCGYVYRTEFLNEKIVPSKEQ